MKMPSFNRSLFPQSFANIANLFEGRLSQSSSPPSVNNNDLRRPRGILTKRENEANAIKKIQVRGSTLNKGVTMIPNEFQVNLGQLEFGRLTFDIEGPSYIRLNHQDLDNGRYKMSYKVTQPGVYIFDVKYRGVQVPGSPFRASVKEIKPKSPPVLDTSKFVVAQGTGLRFSKQGKVATFKVKTKKAGYGRVAVYMDYGQDTKSNEYLDGCPIRYIGTTDGWKIEYICPTEGFYNLQVKYDGVHIPGSPFKAQCLGENEDIPGPGFLSSIKLQLKRNKKDDSSDDSSDDCYGVGWALR